MPRWAWPGAATDCAGLAFLNRAAEGWRGWEAAWRGTVPWLPSRGVFAPGPAATCPAL